MSEGQWREDQDRPLDNRPTLTDALDGLNKDIQILDEGIRADLRGKLKFVSLPDVPMPDGDRAPEQQPESPPVSEAVAMVMHMRANVVRMQSELRHITDQARI